MERFFSNPSNAPRWDANTGITLLSGPPCCGKTSLLFQFAVNRAAESGRGVVFICSKGRLESNPPFLSQGVDPSMSLLQRIQIKHFGLVPLPTIQKRSCQQRYGTTRARDLAMVRVLALCYNAIGHANAKLGTLGSCNLLLSDVHQDDTPRSLFIYQRWIDSIYTIRGDGKGSYILQNIGSPETGSKKARKAKYSIALQYLVLEETSS
ncbi:uncharacterized protein LOC8070504 isoform X3 [Sorghum bicolor]|uniref:Uncharacterized protein n=1 Tax=Sorghum bicolor TaxID=4558 RepID=A0A1Z5S6X1_SORBI|nr:uncharacterized protein LOC8070504 isoform X3 [Sorghum bicolor]OQU91668.1 hypothetical protein SORBI_3001G226200 [Sorghum bicolor]|eukprot:XP_021307206.1 uncharacterized protein LOC8070504 isoform X3 [Sorghum bicolor]